MKDMQDISRDIEQYKGDERKKVVIDIRSEGEFAQGSVPSAINIPRQLLEEAISAGAGYVAMLIGEALDAHRENERKERS